ncbi:hypothetical protein ABZ799_01165 [Nocardiopsis dassonvillei]|uniref:hypothetical protein n=1 Tax=Nocardiopsis dassonvillei TaxID=2014 RepID=UPI0033E1F46B
MDLREKIAEVLYEAPASDGALAKIACDVALRRAQRRADAVMGVVEEDAEKRRAYTELRVELARKAEAAIWETRVWELEDEGARDDQIIRDLNATIMRHNARIAALEDENQRMRAKLSAIGLVKTWTNEDGKSFIFTDDLLIATGDITPDALSRAREIAEEKA